MNLTSFFLIVGAIGIIGFIATVVYYNRHEIK